MDRHTSDRYASNPDSHRHSRGPISSRFSDGPVNHHNGLSPNNFRDGFSGGRDHRPLDSSPRYPPSGGGDGFRPMGGGDGGGGLNPNDQIPPLSGQKRGHPSSGRGGSPERFDGGSFAKLFVGSVPRTATEEDIRPLFEDHGCVLEVALIKDKRTGQQQGCCFIKYATSEEADRAIRAVHNQYTLPGGVGPIQVRYADGERERLGAIEYKLFVGSLDKQATEKEVEEIFSPYGRVEDVYLMRDELKQSRGCAFVKFSQREMALAAINALNGVYMMRGCHQPLIVRFADPKRHRPGESRGGPAFEGPGFGPRFQAPGMSSTPFGEPMRGCVPPNAWRPPSLQNLGSPYNAGLPGFGHIAMSSTLGAHLSGGNGSADGSLPGLAISSNSTSQPFQGFNLSLSQVPSVGQQISPQQKPHQSQQNLPSGLQLQPQTSASYSQTQTSHAQLQIPHSDGQTPLSQALPAQQVLGLSRQLPVSHPQVQHNASSTAAQAPLNNYLQPHVSALPNQQQLPSQQQLLQPLHQSPSQLAQMLSQQTQTLRASFQSSQQAFSQLQQQLQLMQPSSQSSVVQQSSQAVKEQFPWSGIVPHTVANTTAIPPVADVSPAAPAVPVTTEAVAPVKCNWTEHTSPDGYKYYYNSTTGESKWEKPEELALFEKQQQQQLQLQQQKSSVQQPQTQSYPHGLSMQQVPQTQRAQLQSQLQTQFQTPFRQPQQLQQTPQSSSNLDYTQLPVAVGSMNDPARFHQGLQAAQEWMWKNKPAGT